MKLVFAGTPEAAIPSLDAITASAHSIACVVTRADAPLGRKRTLTPSPVAAAAERLGLPVLKTNRLGDDAAAISVLEPDLGVVVAYGGLVREPLLSAPRLGWINLHFSLLPRWRGASPVQRAIIAGDTETGAAVFQLVPALDAGAVYGTVRAPIGRHATAGSMLESLAQSGAQLLLSVIDDLERGTARGTEQVGELTLAPKLTIDDARIDWTQSVDAVYSRLRGVTPEPGAFTSVAGDRLKLLETVPAPETLALAPGVIRRTGGRTDGRVLVGTGAGNLELLMVQPAGRKPMTANDWWRGITAEEVVAS